MAGRLLRLFRTSWWSLAILSTGCGLRPATGDLPPGFVFLGDVDGSIQQDIRYFTSNNFIGRPVAGYFAPRCVLSQAAAEALVEAQRLARVRGLSLKVYDCYRPQRAVNDFVNWAADPDDTLLQHRFYPEVPKSELFARGYIAEQSGHSRGSTVDLTLVPTGSAQPVIDHFANRYDCRRSPPLRYPDNSLDMGTGYDCFDPLSHTDNPGLNSQVLANRQLLRSFMEAAGFSNYPQEWWHYTLVEEPFTDRYFDFPVDDPGRVGR